MSFAKPLKLIAVCAVGLGLGVVAHAAGSPGARATVKPPNARTVKPPNARVEHRPHLGVLEQPRKRFDRSVAIARHRAERARRARASRPSPGGPVATPTSGGSATSGGFPSPESVGVSGATLDAIAACESGGNPAAVSPGGTYRGKYQFDYGTWASVGGSSDPAAASEAEQDYRAALLYSRSGSSPWPICGS